MSTKREASGLQPQQSVTTSFSAIGQPVPQDEGPDKVSGKALYAADVLLPGMLWGKVLRSPYPHAHILSIDTAKARTVPGVHAVLTGQDLPDRRVGRLLRDIPVLARDRVLFVGEKVAAVAAETLEAAEEALVVGQGRVQHLEGDASTERDVLGQEDLGGRARADRREHPVAPAMDAADLVGHARRGHASRLPVTSSPARASGCRL